MTTAQTVTPLIFLIGRRSTKRKMQNIAYPKENDAYPIEVNIFILKILNINKVDVFTS